MATTRRAAATQTRRSQSVDTPRLEWLLGAVGAVLLAVAVSFLIYQGLMHDDGPGAIRASVGEIRPAGDAYLVRFMVHNEGDDTLADLHVTGRLMDAEREIEAARAVVAYLPARSTKEGGFFFRNDPRRYRLEIVPEGYVEP